LLLLALVSVPVWELVWVRMTALALESAKVSVRVRALVRLRELA
jgi:hypothetical protein